MNNLENFKTDAPKPALTKKPWKTPDFEILDTAPETKYFHSSEGAFTVGAGTKQYHS